jgi:HD superfamily phosphohydrolase
MRLWRVYNESIPRFIRDLAATDAVSRLKYVGMNCGVEYTGFSFFRSIGPYSRYDHSIGVALIVWQFTQSKEQAAAGLLHDAGTPVFSHVVDFLNHDHIRQESTEEKTKELIESSDQVMDRLKEHGLSVDDVCDYHRYPVADNDPPGLSADRLEYTLGNIVNFRFRTRKEAEGYYADLTVAENENGEPEIAFRSKDKACAFAEAALRCSEIYVSDIDRFSMQYLADILRCALNLCVLNECDLLTTEPEVIGNLMSNRETAALWEKFRSFSVIHRAETDPKLPSWICVPAKKRYIDPLVSGYGRVTEISENMRNKISRFLSGNFHVWISASE